MRCLLQRTGRAGLSGPHAPDRSCAIASRSRYSATTVDAIPAGRRRFVSAMRLVPMIDTDYSGSRYESVRPGLSPPAALGRPHRVVARTPRHVCVCSIRGAAKPRARHAAPGDSSCADPALLAYVVRSLLGGLDYTRALPSTVSPARGGCALTVARAARSPVCRSTSRSARVTHPRANREPWTAPAASGRRSHITVVCVAIQIITGPSTGVARGSTGAFTLLALRAPL